MIKVVSYNFHSDRLLILCVIQIPDNELNTSNIEIIVIDEDNGPEFDAPEDESSPAPKTPPPVQTADVDEAHKSPIEDEKSKQPEKASEEKTKDTEANKKKRFNEKLPTEWSVSSFMLNDVLFNECLDKVYSVSPI